ncbi:hypothetical protein HBH56_232250 [Parastagonospora nodorum]|uniref:Uncharacterized protein n=2 Tax=Phaeosphaeria nodorum (strain SN15 / ATCC MYA-4574 / FGSC 10173) TaxID=321614 RepID=A0A7U2IDA8_PHANO|nr:hypothetical protein SNOG_16203 [Parastagonospora nodorum SN15]KAH3904539.1 hypothetical protein HBH56_232250 [Parastagonospora nodorum]EAT76387.2 hypothetical protein SNOG_16203 [Parastagonospora nodorum SN15]KAH3921413.1 hypothetical protein HBH54_240830 [Parastagonospora nodorum]KAH4125376.1 hypothetical protein HBH45_231940 [Parastagonospora nodorum]KAH4147743.1 hypothetical protein HBH44_219320 [Parastagonospora nodorum]
MPLTRKNLTAWLESNGFVQRQSSTKRRKAGFALTWSNPDAEPEDEDWDILFVDGVVGRTQKITKTADTNIKNVYPADQTATAKMCVACTAQALAAKERVTASQSLKVDQTLSDDGSYLLYRERTTTAPGVPFREFPRVKTNGDVSDQPVFRPDKVMRPRSVPEAA